MESVPPRWREVTLLVDLVGRSLELVAANDGVGCGREKYSEGVTAIIRWLSAATPPVLGVLLLDLRIPLTTPKGSKLVAGG